MVRRVPSLETDDPAGSKFPDYVAAEIREMIGHQVDGALVNPFYRSAAHVEPIPRMMCPFDVPTETGLIRAVLFTVRETTTVDAILTASVSVSTQSAATACRVGLYQADTPEGGMLPLTCVARSAHDAARWEGGGLDTAPIVDDGAASPATITEVTLDVGVRYAVTLLSVGHTGDPKVTAMAGFRPAAFGPPLGWTLSGQTDLPPTINAGVVEEWSLPWTALAIAD